MITRQLAVDLAAPALRIGPDVAAANADRVENRDPERRRWIKWLTREARLENAPLGARGMLLALASGATAVMCPAFDAGHLVGQSRRPPAAPPIAAWQTDRKGDSLRGLRSSNANSQVEAILLPGLA